MSRHPSLKSRTAIRGSLPSKKCSLHMVHYRGMLARAYIYLLEYDDSVQSYEERPFSIPYSSGKVRSDYTPDFRVQWQNLRPRLVACMPEMTASTPTSISNLTAAQLWCQQHHHDFALITEVTLRPYRVLLSNLEMLAVHSFALIPAPTYDYLLRTIISMRSPFSPDELVQHTPLLDPMQTKSFIWNFVYHGELLTDLTQPLHFARTSLVYRGTCTTFSTMKGANDVSTSYL
jgi:hypothetical protein